jgi:hypothetical protein
MSQSSALKMEQYVSPKRWYLPMSLHGAQTQKNIIIIIIIIRDNFRFMFHVNSFSSLHNLGNLMPVPTSKCFSKVLFCLPSYSSSCYLPQICTSLHGLSIASCLHIFRNYITKSKFVTIFRFLYLIIQPISSWGFLNFSLLSFLFFFCIFHPISMPQCLIFTIGLTNILSFHFNDQYLLQDINLPKITHRRGDGGSKHLWNVCQFVRDYTVQYPRRQSSSKILWFSQHYEI